MTRLLRLAACWLAMTALAVGIGGTPAQAQTTDRADATFRAVY
jgi:hypothetical protein